MTERMAARLGHNFKTVELLQKALTHRSYYFENKGTCPGHYERLEFLGDAVLDLIMSEALMRAYPQCDEGKLSKWRASLVNEKSLSEIAKSMDLGDCLYLGKSEAQQRGELRPRLLSSALEAVIAALYLDAGLEKTREFIEREFAELLRNLDSSCEYAADFKTRLQEWSQKNFRTLPDYRLVSSEGPEHCKTFRFEVYVNNKLLGEGTGGSRKNAEQNAARAAWEKEVNK